MSITGGAPEFKKRTPSGIKPVQRQPVAVPPSGRAVQRDRLSWHQFEAEPTRYDKMPYRQCGGWGLKLPAISLGAWETFGSHGGPELARACIFRAFNLGITHFDLANNYGNPPGRAEIIVGRILKEMPRNEIVVSTKAGFLMWPGPYGDGSSRKYLLNSLDESLQRLGLDYVDIFYSHRPDPKTPLEETLRALDQVVRQGKALYVGLSNYSGAQFREACRLTRELNLSPVILAQNSYSMLRRDIEQDLLGAARETGAGVVAFSVLGQGLLSTKYQSGIPESSRAARAWEPARKEKITPALLQKVQQLDTMAQRRGQTLPQMALVWALRQPEVTTALMGISDPDQLEENIKALEKLTFDPEELQQLDAILRT